MNALSEIFLTCGLTRHSETAQPIQDTAFPTSVHYFPETYRNAQLGLISPVQRVMDDLLQKASTHLNPVAGEQLNGRRAFILAAGNTSFAGARVRQRHRGGFLDFESRGRLLQTTQIQAGRMAQMLCATDHISTDGSACASSMKALMDALHLITVHQFDGVAIMASEDQISEGVLDFFGDMGICLSQDQLDQGVRPSAFDRQNHGFLIAQGAAFAWLETAASMRRSGRQPLARLLSAVTAGEVFTNTIGQCPHGSGYEKAMRWALQQANLSTEKIDLVKTHGTGTRLNNQAEASALRRVFGDQFLATAYKPRIGHTFGASGLLESLLAIQDARAGLVRGIAHRTEPDEIFLSHDQAHQVNHILALSAGMGHVYGAAVWEVLHP
jgi:3-oxoacyl-(acyl-carrier-protein) synthase